MKPMLANRYDRRDPAGFWMSEKLDGVRAIWDGEKLVSRNGKEFICPVWFTADLPSGKKLDGELWMGRGEFESCKGMVKRKAGDWEGMCFVVFDVVMSGSFEQRMKVLDTLELPDHVIVHKHVLCEGGKHMRKFERDVLAEGGEGIMLRKAGSDYRHGYSDDLLKKKQWVDDEARVEKVSGRVLVCQWFDKTIRLTGRGVVGDLVTFAYCGITSNGLPRHTSVIGVRDYE